MSEHVQGRAQASSSRTHTLCFDVIESLGLHQVLDAADQFFALCRQTVSHAAATARSTGEARDTDAFDTPLPETLLRREFVKTLAAHHEKNVLATLDTLDKEEQSRIAVEVHGLASPALADQDDVSAESLRWFDPINWDVSPRSRDEALVTLAYAAYYVHLHETELRQADSTGVVLQKFWQVAESAGNDPRSWLNEDEIRERLLDDKRRPTREEPTPV